MHPNYFDILHGGLAKELQVLSFDAVKLFVEQYLSHQHLDPAVATAFMNRFSIDERTGSDPDADRLFRYALNKYFEWTPLFLQGLQVVCERTTDPLLHAAVRVLGGFQQASELVAVMEARSAQSEHEEARELGLEVLAKLPGCVQAARVLLAADLHEGQSPGEWLARFKCPKVIQPLWQSTLFMHHAMLGDTEQGLHLFGQLEPDRRTVTEMNLAAELFRMTGDMTQACALMEGSIGLDPLQMPMRRRLAEWRDPFQLRPELVNEKDVVIYLYSWNKAELLGRTLDSLAASDIGRAQVKVLLNGCSDDSRQVVRARADRFDGRLEIIELPINIGAPAARNWLIAQDATWQSDYVAFADDDVEVPADWLAHYLTVAEAHERCGVVGCKVLHPGAPAQVQYLNRYVTIADNGLLKLSLPAPNRYYDNGWYDVVRQTRSVMGCLHLFRREALRDCPLFDIRFSPSQVDDIDHDLQLALKGWEAWYTGHVACVHHHGTLTGAGVSVSKASIGNTVGNDLKLYYKHMHQLDALRQLDNLSIS